MIKVLKWYFYDMWKAIFAYKMIIGYLRKEAHLSGLRFVSVYNKGFVMYELCSMAFNTNLTKLEIVKNLLDRNVIVMRATEK